MLTYNIEEIDNEDYIDFVGRIDDEGVNTFQAALNKILELNPGKIVFDFNKLTFINSAGIGKLLLFYKKVKEKDRQKKIVISGINDDLLSMFKMLRVTSLIPIEKG